MKTIKTMGRPARLKGSVRPEGQLDAVLDLLANVERDGRAALQALAAVALTGGLGLAAMSAGSGQLGVARGMLIAAPILAAAAAVVASVTPEACSLALRLRVLPAVGRMQASGVTPAALLMLCGRTPSGTYYTPTRRGRALRTVLQGLARGDRELLHAAARARAAELGLDEQALLLVGRYPDHDGPVSDLASLLALRGSEQDGIDTCERAARRLHARSSVRTGSGGRLLRQVTLPLADVPEQRRKTVALLVQHAAADGTLDDSTVAGLDRMTESLDAEQLQILEQLARSGSHAPDALVAAVEHL